MWTEESLERVTQFLLPKGFDRHFFLDDYVDDNDDDDEDDHDNDDDGDGDYAAQSL